MDHAHLAALELLSSTYAQRHFLLYIILVLYYHLNAKCTHSHSPHTALHSRSLQVYNIMRIYKSISHARLGLVSDISQPVAPRRRYSDSSPQSQVSLATSWRASWTRTQPLIGGARRRETGSPCGWGYWRSCSLSQTVYRTTSSEGAILSHFWCLVVTGS